MARAYRGLAAGRGLAAALAEAQYGLAAEGVHPLEWAGFVVLTGPGTESVGPASIPQD
jgi:hypothetical protein